MGRKEKDGKGGGRRGGGRVGGRGKGKGGEGRREERRGDVEGPGKWSAPGPALALGGPGRMASFSSGQSSLVFCLRRLRLFLLCWDPPCSSSLLFPPSVGVAVADACLLRVILTRLCVKKSNCNVQRLNYDKSHENVHFADPKVTYNYINF